ncbi:MAG: flagellar motor protein MotB [Acetatifactor sp.]|nr:flagellar motor protein MotB [Acetatifactor sp.]
MAKRKADEPKKGAPEWQTTFSDLMNLLLCFFVMLFAMSNMDEQKLQEFIAAMNNSTFSLLNGGAQAVGDGLLVSNGVSQLNELDQYINSTGKTAQSSNDGQNLEEFEGFPENVTVDQLQQAMDALQLQENEELAELMEEAVSDSNIADQVDVSFTAQYVKLTMNGALLFDSGSAQLKTDAQHVLDKVGVILQRYGEGIVEIIGHTDNVPIHSAKYADNEELSSARALSVFYYLVDHTNLDPINLQHAGMGERHPIASNETDEGRRNNRRVEIRIYNQSR